jgi:hypothetical protein
MPSPFPGQRSKANSLASRNWPPLRKCLRRKPSCWKPHFSRTRADAARELAQARKQLEDAEDEERKAKRKYRKLKREPDG